MMRLVLGASLLLQSCGVRSFALKWTELLARPGLEGVMDFMV